MRAPPARRNHNATTTQPQRNHNHLGPPQPPHSGSSVVGAALAFLGVLWFEIYIQQMLAVPLTLAGWPLLASAGLVALSAGFVNHALANGLLNGIACAEFYWTVSLMFALSVRADLFRPPHNIPHPACADLPAPA